MFGRHNIRPPHFASKVSYSASPQTFAECSRSASCCYVATFVWILNTMHKILPANGKITDCLIIERSFFPSHRLLQAAQFFMRFMRTRVISRVAYRCVLHVWYSLSAYFHHSPYTCQRNALPRSIASRPAFDCVSSHVRSCLVPRSLKGIGTVARRSVQKSLSSLCGQSGLRC